MRAVACMNEGALLDSRPLLPYPASKRVLDRLLAALLLVFLGPLIALALAALALDMLVEPRDRGGWLYRERRVSREREFDLPAALGGRPTATSAGVRLRPRSWA